MKTQFVTLAKKHFSAVLIGLMTVAGSCWSPAQGAVSGSRGVVVSASSEASDVGVEILSLGGNAVDAAVAVGFALAVTYPAAGNLGGGGFLLCREALSGKEFTVDFREAAPAGASPSMYLDENGRSIEGLSLEGHLASGVPGSVAGLYLSWKEAGRLPWRTLVEPAIALAEKGFTVSRSLSESLRQHEALLSKFAESRRIFLREGNYYREGDRLLQPELAGTLKLIADRGPHAFYRGEIAGKIVSEMSSGGGLIGAADLSRYQAYLGQPVAGTYRGFEVLSMGSPSGGGVALIEMLNILEKLPVSSFSFGSADLLHLEAEAMRCAYHDRARYMGDARFAKVPRMGLMSKEYAAELARQLNERQAKSSSAASNPDPWKFEKSETTHYSIVDSEGSAVAVTTTLNGGYGSGVTVRGAGFLLNNEMDDFATSPDTPNLYGLVQSTANSIAPGKRPLSSMTPTLVKKGGKIVLVTGSPGGPRITNAVLQVLIGVLDFGMDIQAAVDAPRIHHQWLPDELSLEQGRFPTATVDELQRRGHFISFRESIGETHSILVDPRSGLRFGAPDPRGSGKASVEKD